MYQVLTMLLILEMFLAKLISLVIYGKKVKPMLSWKDISQPWQMPQDKDKSITSNLKNHMQQKICWPKILEFTITLAANTNTNYSSIVVVLPIQIKKKMDKAANIDATTITVNNFFACWLKEVDIKRYPDDVRITPTNNTVSIADYSAQIMKHMPNKSLDTIKKRCYMIKKECFYMQIEIED